ncbi:MAG TPA: agmatinase [Anaerolineae bacterium]|nr:agmatinase [Anaerolineae bacterium]
MTTSPKDTGFEFQPYYGICTFGRTPHTRDVSGAEVAIVGVPYDGATSYRSGARFGPRAIREQSMLLWGYNNALNVSPFKTLKVIDYGDVDVVPVDVLATHAAINEEVSKIVKEGVKVITLGGDHSIALPLLRAHAQQYGPLAVVHFDAHPDTWDSEFGDRKYSHGTPFRRAIEENLIDTSAYIQIGIRGPTSGRQDYEDALALGARMITIDEAMSLGLAGILKEVKDRVQSKRLYVTLDIDSIDPAFAPGTGTPEVGGFSSYQMLQLLRGLKGLNFVGGDLVEVSPPFDHSNITAILASNLVFEYLALLALNKLKVE